MVFIACTVFKFFFCYAGADETEPEPAEIEQGSSGSRPAVEAIPIAATENHRAPESASSDRDVDEPQAEDDEVVVVIEVVDDELPSQTSKADD